MTERERRLLGHLYRAALGNGFSKQEANDWAVAEVYADRRRRAKRQG